jgi:hypothetical protein
VLTAGVNAVLTASPSMVCRPPEVDGGNAQNASPQSIPKATAAGDTVKAKRQGDRHSPGYMVAYMRRRRARDRTGKAETAQIVAVS